MIGEKKSRRCSSVENLDAGRSVLTVRTLVGGGWATNASAAKEGPSDSRESRSRHTIPGKSLQLVLPIAWKNRTCKKEGKPLPLCRQSSCRQDAMGKSASYRRHPWLHLATSLSSRQHLSASELVKGASPRSDAIAKAALGLTTFQRMLESLLLKWTYDATVVADGIEAFRPRQRGCSASGHFGLDDAGNRRCPDLSTTSRTQGPPYIYVLLLTARSQKQDLLYCLELGTDDHLTNLSTPRNFERVFVQATGSSSCKTICLPHRLDCISGRPMTP